VNLKPYRREQKGEEPLRDVTGKGEEASSVEGDWPADLTGSRGVWSEIVKRERGKESQGREKVKLMKRNRKRSRIKEEFRGRENAG